MRDADKEAFDVLQALFAFWKERLNLLDLIVSLEIVDRLEGEKDLIEVAMASERDDPNHAVVKATRKLLRESPEFLSSTVCHELVHVLLWPLRYALDGRGTEFSDPQNAAI